MKDNYEKSLNNLFDEKAALSAEKLKGFFDESLQFIQDLQESLASSDTEVKEGALQKATEIKAKLEAKLEEMCKTSGIDLKQIAALNDVAMHTTHQERKTIEEMEQKFNAFQRRA
jgi:flagellin-specific chaperone FliS